MVDILNRQTRLKFSLKTYETGVSKEIEKSNRKSNYIHTVLQSFRALKLIQFRTEFTDSFLFDIGFTRWCKKG